MGDYSQSESMVSAGEDGGAATKDASQLDSAGQAILKLLHKAAGATEANSRRALETAQKLASQLKPKIESLGYKRRFSTTVRSLNALKSGSAKFP